MLCRQAHFWRMSVKLFLQLQRRAGAKGFGLFTKEDLQAGQFIIEYIGEVQPKLQLLG